MSAETASSIRVDSTEWVELSSADVQTLQVTSGQIGLIYADTQPSSDVEVKEMGYVFNEGDFLSNNNGGTAWVRAKSRSGDSIVAVVEDTSSGGVTISSDPVNYDIEAAAGRITGTSTLNKFGQNPNIAQNTTETICDTGDDYPFPASADITHISQAADETAMRGAEINIQGLDASWNLVVQTKNLDASDSSTLVALDTPLIRVFRLKVQAAVTATEIVQVTDSGETTVYAQIQPGNNQTLMAVYTVPNGKTLYLNDYYATLNPAASKDPTALTISLWVRDNENDYAPQLKHRVGLDISGTSALPHIFKPPMKVSAKCDIYITAYAEGKAADVSAGFDGVLEDD